MVYEAVLFDVDGTLAYTLIEYRYDVVGRTLDECGGKASLGDIDSFWFEGGRDEIIKKRFELVPEVFWSAFRKYDFLKLRREATRVYDDVNFIDELREKGFKIGAVTGAPSNISSINLDLIGVHRFDMVVNAYSENGVRAKPDPHGLELCLGGLGVGSGEAVYVGNGSEDIGAARNAGVLDVLIDRGEYDFSDPDPTIRITSLYELRELLGL